jgi:hypothetical protein
MITFSVIVYSVRHGIQRAQPISVYSHPTYQQISSNDSSIHDCVNCPSVFPPA